MAHTAPVTGGPARNAGILILGFVTFTLGFVAATALSAPGPGPADVSRRERANRERNGTASSAGRAADSPAGIGPHGWRDILARTWREIAADRVFAVAAGVTFYGLLAIFPAMAALVSLYGLLAEPETMIRQIGALAPFLPAGAPELLQEHALRFSAAGDQKLGLSLAISLALSVWSANAGMKAAMDALNVAYDEDEKRGFFRLNAISLAFTTGLLLFAALAVLAVAAVPAILPHLPAGHTAGLLAQYGRWPVLIGVLVVALALLYRFGPSREKARWRWVSPGAICAALAWLAGSAAFSWYVANFEDYDKIYGALGAVIGLAMWMWLSSIVILAGAELNAESERQTGRDSTTGAPQPMGLRGADAADRKPRIVAETS